MVSGKITGWAAAAARRSSTSSITGYGNTDRAIRNASGHPGRSGCGVNALANNNTASTALVLGRSTTAARVRVAMSTSPVSSARSVLPSSSTTSTSNGVESISISSPGRNAVTTVCAPSGRRASDRRVRAEANVPRPASIASTSR
jgi:hypothetical protein